MKPEIKEHLYGADQLQELIGLSRTQAWRIWNGHSKLTKQNEELLLIKLDLKKKAREDCEMAADAWVQHQKEANKGGNFFSNKIVGAHIVSANIYLVTCEDTMRFLDELIELKSRAKYDSTRDVLTDSYFDELDNWIVSTKDFLIEDFK
ncbi:hypothetical protein NVP1112O_68 [Vibrio phage 1.112.O._10N.286.46.B11]|nr:hypothetical protein NVP1112O_68 [Vibrio phage 1.112.O._10N.286.46.B11]